MHFAKLTYLEKNKTFDRILRLEFIRDDSPEICKTICM